MNTQVFFFMIVLLSFTLAYPQAAGITLYRRTGTNAAATKVKPARKTFSLGTFYANNAPKIEQSEKEKAKKDAATATRIANAGPTVPFKSKTKLATEAQNAYNKVSSSTKMALERQVVFLERQMNGERSNGNDKKAQRTEGELQKLESILREKDAKGISMQKANQLAQGNYKTTILDLHGWKGDEESWHVIDKFLEDFPITAENPQIQIVVGLGNNSGGGVRILPGQVEDYFKQSTMSGYTCALKTEGPNRGARYVITNPNRL
jgi:hypothetical protein